MQISEGKHDRREVEACDVGREPLSAPEVSEELPSRDVGQEHVNIEAVLEGGVEIDNERMPHAGHDITLRINVLDLSESDDLRLAKDLEGEAIRGSRLVGGTAKSNEQHTTKCSGTCEWQSEGKNQWLGDIT